MTVSETSLVGRESRTVRDPFLNKDVQVSDRLLDRLRGRYACGPTMENGEPEFGWREHETPPIQHEAAETIERLTRERDEQRSNGYELLGAALEKLQARLDTAEAQRDGAYEHAASIAFSAITSVVISDDGNTVLADHVASAIRAARLKPDQKHD